MALQEAKKHWHCSESLGKPLNPYLLLFSVFRVSVEPKILTLFSDGVCRRRDESKAPAVSRNFRLWACELSSRAPVD